MKKIVIEIPYPETELIESPSTWITEFGEFDNMDDVNSLDRIMEYITKSKDSYLIINAHINLRTIIVTGLLQKFSGNVNLINDYHLISKICSVAHHYRDGVGYDPKDYVFEVTPGCKGTKLKTHYGAIFDTEYELAKNLASYFVSRTFTYKLVEDDTV